LVKGAAKEVYKTELRIRAEIERGKSLSEVLDLAKWETA
jgi:regulator of RNase E activity RraA